MKLEITEREGQVLKTAIQLLLSTKTKQKKNAKLNEHDMYDKKHTLMLGLILWGKLTKDSSAIAHYMNPLQKPKE